MLASTMKESMSMPAEPTAALSRRDVLVGAEMSHQLA